MARYIGALCRFAGGRGKAFLKGDRCYRRKCAVERRKYPPGQHGQGFRNYLTTDSIEEKQKVRKMYGS